MPVLSGQRSRAPLLRSARLPGDPLYRRVGQRGENARHPLPLGTRQGLIEHNAIVGPFTLMVGYGALALPAISLPRQTRQA